MSKVAIFCVCLQACLIQMAFSQYLPVGNSGFVASSFEGYGYVPDVVASASLPVSGPYIGSGFGEIAVGGEVAAYGSAAITGSVPVVGVVTFSGSIPASGVVSLAGNCGCA